MEKALIGRRNKINTEVAIKTGSVYEPTGILSGQGQTRRNDCSRCTLQESWFLGHSLSKSLHFRVRQGSNGG